MIWVYGTVETAQYGWTSFMIYRQLPVSSFELAFLAHGLANPEDSDW